VEKYKKPLHPLSCLFVLVYFFLLLEAMNESALDKLKREARKKELEKKVQAAMKK
jgi:cell division protein FtsB